MCPQAGHNNWAPIPIEPRIIDEGNLRCHIKATDNVSSVIGFADALPPIMQAAIAQHKTKSSQRKISAVIPSQPTVDKGASQAVILPVPEIARKVAAKGEGAVHLTESE